MGILFTVPGASFTGPVIERVIALDRFDAAGPLDGSRVTLGEQTWTTETAGLNGTPLKVDGGLRMDASTDTSAHPLAWMPVNEPEWEMVATITGYGANLTGGGIGDDGRCQLLVRALDGGSGVVYGVKRTGMPPGGVFNWGTLSGSAVTDVAQGPNRGADPARSPQVGGKFGIRATATHFEYLAGEHVLASVPRGALIGPVQVGIMAHKGGILVIDNLRITAR